MAQSTGRQAGMMVGGFALGMVALFSLPLAVREMATSLVRHEFVRDVFVVESYNDAGDNDPVLIGKLESTGETYTTTRDSIVGVDRLQALKEHNKLAGAPADVWYLPRRGVWE